LPSLCLALVDDKDEATAGVVSTQAELRARNHAKESLGFNFIASASAAFASGALSTAA
jgi:hypothetical protein